MKKRITIYITILLVSIVVIVVYLISTQSQRKYRFEITNVEISDNDAEIIYGSDTAKLTIYMFLDYKCGFCRKFLLLNMPFIQKLYTESGLVRFVIKPIELGENMDMMSAIQLAICMNNDGNADDILELLKTEPSAVYSDEFRQLIDDILTGNPKLAECMVADDFSGIRENNRIFNATSSNGTPIFVINNHLYKGYKEINKFRKIVDYELNK